ncbi:PLAC8 family [Phytophthora infestans]|uniref:PLAC8 family n=1 Tax=Phytophthora infestans TaxID=4787 RepID=A0A833SPY2_PHYIN|nr:PLAC8 family [Phytophthora infestans]KAF4146033.1 PLAC8 family [Phytophthora infestans]
MSKSAAAYTQARDPTAMPPKQVPTLPVIKIVFDANPPRPVRREPAQPRPLSSSRSTWNASICDCCCSVAPTYCCVVTCCPCTTIASVKESLSGGYERTLLYFGGLALGFLISVGFAASNSSDKSTDVPVGPRPSSPSESSQAEDSGHSTMWQAFAALFLITFLLGVWRLRTQTRHSLGIQGSQLNDCLSSFCCCFCVISQLHLELKCQHSEPATPSRQTRRGQDSNLTSVDTLAPYAVM